VRVSSSPGQVYTASSGNDQRVKLLLVGTDSARPPVAHQAIRVYLQVDRYCPVADVALMDVVEGGLRETVLEVGGVVMEMLRLSL
jgi:hypothetical protein